MTTRVLIPPQPSPRRAHADAVLVWLPQILWTSATWAAGASLAALGAPFSLACLFFLIGAAIAGTVARAELRAARTKRLILTDRAERACQATQDEAAGAELVLTTPEETR